MVDEKGDNIRERAGYRISRVEVSGHPSIYSTTDQSVRNVSSKQRFKPAHGERSRRGGDDVDGSSQQTIKSSNDRDDAERIDRTGRRPRIVGKPVRGKAVNHSARDPAVETRLVASAPRTEDHESRASRTQQRPRRQQNPRHYDPPDTVAYTSAQNEHHRRCRRNHSRNARSINQSGQPHASAAHQHHSGPAEVEPNPTQSSPTSDALTAQCYNGPDCGDSSDGTQLYVRGACMLMCPVEETKEREKEGDLSIFEATEETRLLHFRERRADPAKIVKKYRRSAAGRDMHRPEQLRPLLVLQKTTRYLVKDVFTKACIEDGGPLHDSKRVDTQVISTTAKAYGFVEDRLRSVRQDLIVQGLGAAVEALEVLKIAANFYVVAGYLMSDQPSNVFDAHLHSRELQGVFTSLAEVFLQARGATVYRSCMMLGEDEYLCMQAVHGLARALSITYDGDTPLTEAIEGKGIHRVVATTLERLAAPPQPQASADFASNGGTLPVPTCSSVDDRGSAYESLGKTYPKIAMAVRLLRAVSTGNWSEFNRIVGRMSTTREQDEGNLSVAGQAIESPFALRIRCLCHTMLLPVRAHALRAMNRSFGKGERVPLSDLQGMLQTRTVEDIAGLCRALSLPVEGEDVVFKSVPAVWKNPRARRTGFLAPEDGGNSRTLSRCLSLSPRREDEWVGLTRDSLGLGLGLGLRSGKRKDEKASGSCWACAGFGCSRCAGSKGTSQGGFVQNLWEAVLAPC